MKRAKTFDGTPCKNCHGTRRYVANGQCVVCRATYYERNRAKIRERHAAYHASHSAQVGQRKRKYAEERKERKRAYDAAHYAANANVKREQVAQWRQDNPHLAAEFWKRWRERNPDKVVLNSRNQNALRRLSAGRALAKRYADDIKKIYAACPLGHHVDHIVPLRGKAVSGLHVPWNLQYLPAIENRSKGNKLIS